MYIKGTNIRAYYAAAILIVYTINWYKVITRRATNNYAYVLYVAVSVFTSRQYI